MNYDPYAPAKLVSRGSAYFMVAIVLFVGGFFTHAYVTEPNCPTEDSCSYVYENGKAKIVEVTP